MPSPPVKTRRPKPNMETTHRFSTPLSRDLFQLGAESMMDGALHSFSKKPVTLPGASPRDVQDELTRLDRTTRRDNNGRPSEL